ncbi:MAG: WecB/TagA/CpsF family glycosyltransferase [Smithella sp.]|nr:WecB/TagA/CpsF family glycosyltransferase [Smithella sp.]
MNVLKVFNYSILNITMQEAVGLIKSATQKRKSSTFLFANAHCLNIAFSDRDYHDILLKAPYIFGDGIGVRIAGRVAGTPFVDNVNGTDMFPHLCEVCICNGLSMYLFGARPGIADIMKQKIEQRYNGIKIAGIHHGYFNSEKEIDDIISGINAANPDILLVALGVPMQEKWISHYSGRINAPVRLAVGGLFDFYSDTIKRAPLWVRKLNMEWFYRLLQEPRRMWRRYLLGNPLFLFRVIKWKLFRTGK